MVPGGSQTPGQWNPCWEEGGWFSVAAFVGWNGLTGISTGNSCHPQVEDYQRGTMLLGSSQVLLLGRL